MGLDAWSRNWLGILWSRHAQGDKIIVRNDDSEEI